MALGSPRVGGFGRTLTNSRVSGGNPSGGERYTGSMNVGKEASAWWNKTVVPWWQKTVYPAMSASFDVQRQGMAAPPRSVGGGIAGKALGSENFGNTFGPQSGQSAAVQAVRIARDRGITSSVPSTPQSGQSYLNAYNNRQQNAAASALNQGMRASADATRWSTEADLNFQQAQIAAANAAAMGDYERANQLRGIAEQYASGVYAVGKAGVDVTGKALDRQVGYQGDMRRIDQWTNIGEIAGTDIDARANERQFGLINAARGDLGANLAREKARLTDVEAGISQNEQTVKRQERQAQYKAFSDAAASGNVSQISRMNAKELKSSLTDNLADFQRERNQAGRQRAQAEQDYQTQMRDLQEQEASAVDAREKLKLRRQIQLLNEQRQQRQYQEELAQIEDRKKENFLNLMTIELERRKGIGERDVDRQKAEADRLNAFYTAVAGQQNITQQRLAAAAQQNATKQMYPAPNTLLPPTYRRGRGPAR